MFHSVHALLRGTKQSLKTSQKLHALQCCIFTLYSEANHLALRYVALILNHGPQIAYERSTDAGQGLEHGSTSKAAHTSQLRLTYRLCDKPTTVSAQLKVTQCNDDPVNDSANGNQALQYGSNGAAAYGLFDVRTILLGTSAIIISREHRWRTARRHSSQAAHLRIVL